ncbi:hypothetical protein [Jannaschia aquimarina]|uniref:hypothetical protein n=1 Tax=Jannaschia aquimarina TaxID=935700 RepID=UPI000B673D7F|nr:hypothetical protein [Jannaschia aquimarina]SNT25546.1 hypothetical protein SAMN05421775_10925 [Jannaschia aquimarina]
MTGSDLSARLARLADRDPPRVKIEGRLARVVAPAGTGTAGVILAILEMVDDTMLPARLTFAEEGGARLALDVAARRVVGMDEATAVAALESFGSTAKRAVAVIEGPSEAESNEGGISVRKLAAALPQATEEQDDSDAPVQMRLIDGMGDALFAGWARDAEGGVDIWGEGDLLEAFVEGIWSGVGDRDETDPRLSCWTRPAGDPGAAMAIAVAEWPDGTIAALSFDPASMNRLQSIWLRVAG